MVLFVLVLILLTASFEEDDSGSSKGGLLSDLLLVVAIGGLVFFQAEDGIRGAPVTGVQTCALPIWRCRAGPPCWPPRRFSWPAWCWPPGPSPSADRCWPGGSSCPATASLPRAASRWSPWPTARRCAPPRARSST